VPEPASPPGVAGAGDPCEGVSDPYYGSYDNCEGGYMCLARPGTSTFVCEKLCTGTDRGACTDAYPAAGGGTRSGLCIYNLGAGMPVADLMVCALPDDCDPRCQDCTGVDVACYPASDGIHYGTLCAEVATPGTSGAVCTFLNDCDAGYYCQTDRCRQFCDVTGSSSCTWDTCGAGTGTCGIPSGYPAEMFSTTLGWGLCLP